MQIPRFLKCVEGLGGGSGEASGLFFLQGSSEALRPVGEGVTAPLRKGKRARLPLQEGDGRGQAQTWGDLPTVAQYCRAPDSSSAAVQHFFFERGRMRGRAWACVRACVCVHVGAHVGRGKQRGREERISSRLHAQRGAWISRP